MVSKSMILILVFHGAAGRKRLSSSRTERYIMYIYIYIIICTMRISCIYTYMQEINITYVNICKCKSHMYANIS